MKQQMQANIEENFIMETDASLMRLLLKDNSSGKNLIWATDEYLENGTSYTHDGHITVFSITGKNGNLVKPRVVKSKQIKLLRIRDKAEVFTPSSICNRQNNLVDDVWFGRRNVFNTETCDGWQATHEKIAFPAAGGKSWQDYVTAVRIEITCGEAPYLCSRYDTVTGEVIPVAERIGLLDRKLRVVSENTDGEADWIEWAIKAVKSTYGYDWQGDNVLIARENLLFACAEAFEDKFGKPLAKVALTRIAEVLVWNIWQMDGLKFVVPCSCKDGAQTTYTLLGEQLHEHICEGCRKGNPKKHNGVYSYIMDWTDGKRVKFVSLMNRSKPIKFDAVVGNPPFQENIGNEDGNVSLGKQLFHSFIICAVKLKADCVTLISPSRWFKGDAQDKSFVKLRKFFRDHNHISDMVCYRDASEIFENVIVKGGINYFLYQKNYDGLVNFTTVRNGKRDAEQRKLFEDDLDIILDGAEEYGLIKKVMADSRSFTSITKGRNAFGIIGKKDVLDAHTRAERFEGSVKLYCKNNGVLWIDRTEITKNAELIDKYKVYISKSAGDPARDKNVIGKPILGEPGSCCTDSLIPVGEFEDIECATNLQKYFRTKFLRYMVSILKASQNVTQIVYKFVPLQDFSQYSDVDWSVSIGEIDRQLYAKYGLSDDEVSAIESTIKSME